MIEELQVTHHDLSIPVSVARPQGAPKGGVIILASIFGNDQGTLSIAEELAKHHLLAVVPDLFFRGDSGPCGFDGEEKKRAFARMASYERERGLRDLEVVTHWVRAELQGVGRDHLTAHGICFGGHLAAHLACRGLVDALCTVHGGKLDSVSDQHALTVPASLHFGDQDTAIPMDKVETVRSNWPHAEIVLHSGAAHGFAHPGAPAFVAEAHQESFERLLELSLPT